MYKNILVPLDGSELAERTLPMAIETASRFEAGLTLIAVVPEGDAGAEAVRSRLVSALPTERPTISLDYAEDTGPKYDPGVASENAQRYLDKLVRSMPANGSTPKAVVSVGDAAEEIVGAARRENADLIMISTRGRSGLVRGLLGSVTDRVLQTSDVPVLIVRAESAPESGNETVSIDSIICPVDGSERSESGVSHASAFARSFDSKVVIMHSVGGSADAMVFAFMPEALSAGMSSDQMQTASNREIEEAQFYVDKISAQLKSDGIQTETRVQRGGAREQILSLTEQLNAGMIVMNTRGNTGARRWALGSVADGVIRTAPVPTLVIRGE